MWKFKGKKSIFYIVITIALLGVAYFYFFYNKNDNNTDIPQAKNLNIPFTDQAPIASWQEPWLNACEETTIIMADNFYKDTKISSEQARQQILNILAIKEQEFGKSKDESMERIAEIVNLAKLPWKATVSVNPLLNDIKKEISENHPVIAPIDPHFLNNSRYPSSLNYHVLIISGYDDKTDEFIVQDPGTETGKNDRYGYQNFYDAINDYLPNASPSGRKAVLFTAPN